MKKMLTMLIAVMTVLGTFTACGDESESPVSEVSESIITESSEEETEPPAEHEETTSETSEIPQITTSEQTLQSETVSSNDEYIAAFNRVREAVLNSDEDEFIKNVLPSAVYEAAEYAGFLTEFAVSSGLTTDNYTHDFDYDSIEIISAEPLKLQRYSDDIEKAYIIYDKAMRTAGELGFKYEMFENEEDVDDSKWEEFDELFENMESTVDFQSIDIVTMNIDGEEVKMCFFKCTGEEMKMELIFAEEIKEENENFASDIASSIYKAANSALVELDEEGIDVSGLHVICSDTSKNIVSGELADNLDLLYNKMSVFFKDIDEYDYFVVISDYYSCDYSAVYCDDGNVGTYPKSSLVDGIDGERINFEFATEEFADHLYDFDELYKMTINSLYE